MRSQGIARRGLLACLALGVAVAACDGGTPSRDPLEFTDAGLGPFLPGLDASVGSEGDAGLVPRDAEALLVRLGIAPTALADELDGGRPVDVSGQARADAEVVAIGARSVVVDAAWEELASPQGVVDDGKIKQLATRLDFFASAGLEVSVSLNLVHGTSDQRPVQLRRPWSDAGLTSRFQQLVDALLVLKPRVRYLSLGVRVDEWLASLGADERRSSAAFLVKCLEYVADHPERASLSEVGVELSLAAAVAPDAELERLLDASQVVMVQFVPVLGAAHAVEAPTLAVARLETALGKLVSSRPAQTVLLQRFGFPSSPLAGSSPQLQAQFYAELFAAMNASPEVFTSAHAWGLYDGPADECAPSLSEFGQPIEEHEVAFDCSLGLKDSDGAEKPAWQEFLKGTSAFYVP